MTESSTIRKLAAIVSADVVGYSRLMGDDEEGTLFALKSHRRELIDPKIEELHGRIVKTTGDGMLIEFPSVVDALKCCLVVQKGMLERNRSVPEEQRIQFRVGVNLGDIIIDGDDLFGDGVNVAARLEAIAPPGGICVSSGVVEQVRQKLPVKFEDLGEQALKNIDAPIHVYRVSQAASSVAHAPLSSSDDALPDLHFELPERPSIAIMPFRNLSQDEENDYIADGIGLGIQTLLVQLPGLFLINAASHLEYSEGRQTATEAMLHLPVRYALEGTVQRMGDRVRVTVQVTDLQDGAVTWAEQYDRDLEDVFALQDDITREVTSALNVQFFGREMDRVLTKALSGGGAWEYFLRGVSYIYQFTKEDNDRARQMFEKLYDARPDRVQGPGYIALTHWLDVVRGWANDREDSLRQAAEWAAKAIEYGDHESDGVGHVVMSYVRLNERRHDEALELCEKAVQLRSNCPAALGLAATVQLYCGDARKAVKSARESLAVRTMCPPVTINLLANAYRDNGEINLSISAAREAVARDPGYTDALATLCTDYALVNDLEQAKGVAEEILNMQPQFRISEFVQEHPYRNKSTIDGLASALSMAGLPE